MRDSSWRSLVTAAALILGLAVACGGSGGGSGFDENDGGGGAGGAGDDSGAHRDGSLGGDDSGILGGDSGMTCKPKSCAQLGVDCGPQNDGCGNVIQCGSCPMGEICGGGGPSKCGKGTEGGPCTPKTCMQLGYDCGPASDGCNGLLQCGTCPMGQTCGAGGTNKCGMNAPCVNLCMQQGLCEAGMQATLSGVIRAPAANGDPIYNALVYVPNSTVQPFPDTISCDSCGGAQASGDPLVLALTDSSGKFTITNMPTGTNIPLVIQLGKWRRVVTLPMVTCGANTLPDSLAHFPSRQAMGSPLDNIPRIAMVTGTADSLECVLRKIGIEDGQFGDPTGSGAAPRIHFYTGNGMATPDPNTPNWAPGAKYDANTPNEDALFGGTVSAMNRYDAVILACQGGDVTATPSSLANLVTYANAGGRLFATHYSYSWIYTNSPFNTTANWSSPNDPLIDDTYTLPATIDQTNNPKGPAFANWLVNVGASTTKGVLPIQHWRWDIQGGPTGGLADIKTRWVYADAFAENGNVYPGFVEHYTFPTPVGAPAANQCGKVLFSDFHVSSTTSSGLTFPMECDSNPLTPQEKALEFMLFDLASCVQEPNPMCMPLNCMQQGLQCGPAGDGCGNEIQCGTCPGGQTCGGGGTPGKCGSGSCMPLTCAQQNIACGQASDGCGGLLQCGMCVAPQTCGGGGTPGQCGGGPPH